jgi:hypothetical protein
MGARVLDVSDRYDRIPFGQSRTIASCVGGSTVTLRLKRCTFTELLP